MSWVGLDPVSARAVPAFADDGGKPACVGADPELFFPRNDAGNAWKIRKAKALCRVCPCAGACLDFALGTSQRNGVWGGLTADERGWVQSGAMERPPRYKPGGR